MEGHFISMQQLIEKEHERHTTEAKSQNAKNSQPYTGLSKKEKSVALGPMSNAENIFFARLQETHSTKNGIATSE